MPMKPHNWPFPIVFVFEDCSALLQFSGLIYDLPGANQ